MDRNNENRIHPRVQAGFETEVILSDGECLSVTTSNLSLTGVMIHASHQDFEMILKKQKLLNEPIEVDLKFKLTNKNSKPIVVTSHCRTVYVRRIAQDKYFIGFKYLKINQRFQAAIQKFIQEHLDLVSH